MSQDRPAPGPENNVGRRTVQRQGLRTGYTTGACAAAAAKAATRALLTGRAVQEVTIHLPIHRDASFTVHDCQWVEKGKVLCAVIKDAGDDPDVTHGATICATVWRGAKGENGVTILGGRGVGVVTLPGTGIPVGAPAITRVPRRMISEAVSEANSEINPGVPGGLVVEVSVPGGEELAKKTDNARLGILGGISILGSTGIVQPFSTASWRASVNVSIDVAAANSPRLVIISTGTQSEAFAKRSLDFPQVALIDAGIFTGAALKRCMLRKIPRVVLVGMIGKLSKVAAGHFVTHVAGNKVDPSFLVGLAGECGASQQLREELLRATSARHFQEMILASGLESVFQSLCQRVCAMSQKYLGESAPPPTIDCILFDFEGHVLGQASTSSETVPLSARARKGSGL